MEANPYAAPTAEIDDAALSDASHLESRKSRRGKRLGAALIDGLVNIVWIAPFVVGVMMADGVNKGTRSASLMVGLMLVAFVVGLVLLLVNCVMVHRRGQTVGKRALDIAVVRSTGERVSLRRYLLLRALPVSIIGAVPGVGWVMILGDPLMIFGEKRRCLHDLIADTIVVDV